MPNCFKGTRIPGPRQQDSKPEADVFHVRNLLISDVKQADFLA